MPGECGVLMSGRAALAGMRSSCATRLNPSTVIGNLAILESEPDAFDEREGAPLSELADDLA